MPFTTTSHFVGEEGYLALARLILEQGDCRENRTGIRTKALIGTQVQYPFFQVEDGFTIPIFTTKRVAVKSMVVELEWFVKGNNNIRFLEENNCTIWTEWPFVDWLKKTGQIVPEQGSSEWIEKITEFRSLIINDDNFAEEFGSIGDGSYGVMWRAYPGPNREIIDQLQGVVDQLKTGVDNRRMIVNAWHPALIHPNYMQKAALSHLGNPRRKTYLPPCHLEFQFSVTSDAYLICTLTQRSADYFLGVPFNVASYSILTHILAKITGLKPGGFVHTMVDTHLYENTFEAMEKQLRREVKDSPNLILQQISSLEDFHWQMVKDGLRGYNPHPAIKAEVAI